MNKLIIEKEDLREWIHRILFNVYFQISMEEETIKEIICLS